MEEVTYKVPKMVRLGKAEARWWEGPWLGTLENSDERLDGTRAGVIKYRCSAGMADNFDAKAVEELRGYPWQPPTRHTGTKLRANTVTATTLAQATTSPDKEYHRLMPKNIHNMTNMIEKSHGHKSRADDAKCGAAARCLGCRFVTRAVTTQCGHTGMQGCLTG